MRARVVLCLLAGSLLSASPVLAAAVPTEGACPLENLSIVEGEPRDTEDVCEGAKDAVSFFYLQGFHTNPPLELKIVSRLPEEVGPTAVGSYWEKGRRILMLPYAEFRKYQTWFQVDIDRRLYRSLATHEVAHALASCNFAISNPTIQAKEYLAYVAMFTSMEPGLRARILQAIPGSGFASEAKITPIFYMFDPMRFGAEAYRHYMKAENGPRFLREVLAGRALID